MSSDYIGKTLAELRVCDLKVELEKRELETTGVKPSLVSRLEKALIEEGHDPSAYVFNGDTKIESIAQEVPTTESNCDSVDIVKDEPIESNDNADAEVIEVDEKKEDEPIVEAIESVEPTEPTEPIEEVKQETEIESNNDNDQEHLQLTVVDADKLDTSNVDNEDSLNLTIGEEEAKIFQDEEADEKIKESNIEDKSNGNDTSADGKNGSSGNVHSGDNNKTFKSNVSSKKDDGKTDRNDINELDDGDNAAQDNEEDIVDGTSGSGGGSKKGDESETKTSPSKTLKDDKETSSKASNNLSSTSSTKISSTPASRNLWVSGLSSLTRATDLKIIFSKFGKVIGAKVVTNTRTPGTRCFGYVTMNSSTDATKCITNLHRTELHGRIISVERAKSDIGNIGNKTKRVQGSQEAKVTDDEKRTSQATSDRSKKAKDDELTEKSGGSSDNSKSASNNNNNKALTNKEKPADGASDASKTPANNATSEKDEAGAQSDAGATGKQTKSSSQRNDGSKRPAQPDRTRRPTDAERAAARRDRKRERDRAAVLSYRKIKEERERTRMRERERKLREEERHRAAERRRNRDEEERLKKERNKLRDERLRLEREKADLLRLERERQKLEREKIELERLELKRQQLKIEEARRAMKRPASETDRYNDIDRKRSSNDRRFDPPPPPKISIYPSNSTKRSEDYKSSSRSSISNDCSRGNSEMSSSFKRPINDGYSKRSNDIDQTSRSTSAYAQRSGVPQMSSSGKEHRFNESDSRSGGSNFARHRVDDRESRGSAPSRKSRYMEGHSNGNSNERYDRQQSSSSPAWNNGPPSSVKSFNVPNELWGALGKVPQNQESNNWGRMENQNQERYDRTYNERNPKYMDSNTNASNSGNRPTSFINNSRTQDRYNMPNRFDGGRF